MPLDLHELVKPQQTAIVAFECQVGIIGPDGPFPALVEAVRAGRMIERLAALMEAARAVGAQVVHATANTRPDGRGSSQNTRMQAAAARSRASKPFDPTSQQIVPELGPRPEDLVIGRLHGITPFYDTGLDAALRNLGIRTVIATGVSVNVGVTGLVFEAATRGYQVVLPRDCVAGIPADFVDSIIANSLSLLATVTTSEAIIAAWRAE